MELYQDIFMIFLSLHSAVLHKITDGIAYTFVENKYREKKLILFRDKMTSLMF